MPAALRLLAKLWENDRGQVARLRDALAMADAGPEVVEAVRALSDRVELHPGADGKRSRRIEPVGHLVSLLRLPGAYGPGNAQSPSAITDGLGMFLSSEFLGCGDAQPTMPIHHSDHLNPTTNQPLRDGSDRSNLLPCSSRPLEGPTKRPLSLGRTAVRLEYWERWDAEPQSHRQLQVAYRA